MNRLIGLIKPSNTALVSGATTSSNLSLVRLCSQSLKYSTDNKDKNEQQQQPPQQQPKKKQHNKQHNKQQQQQQNQQPQQQQQQQQQDMATNIQSRQQRPQIVQRPHHSNQNQNNRQHQQQNVAGSSFNQSFTKKSDSPAANAFAAASNELNNKNSNNNNNSINSNDQDNQDDVAEDFDEEFDEDEEAEEDNFENIDEKLFDGLDINVNIAEGYENVREAEREVKVNKRQPVEKMMPYHYSSRELEGLLRSHLKKFLAKVHPDNFHQDPSKSQVNQRSLTALNNLLRTRDSYVKVAEGSSEELKLDKIPTTLSLAFHHHTLEGTQGFLEHELIFEEPAPTIATSKSALVSYVTELRFAVHRQLYELFRKADISIPQIELDQLTRPTNEVDQLVDDPWEEYFDAPKDGESEFALTRILDEFIVQNNVSEHRQFAELSLEQTSLLQLFNEDKVFFYFGEQIKGDVNVMRTLGYREEAERQILHLKSQLQSLEFREWHQLPILITSPQFYEKLANSAAAQSFVILNKDFDPLHVLPYIKQKVPRVVKNFKDLYSISKNNITMLEKSTIQLEKTLGANSVVIENLFSVNQRSMRSVRDQFNRSQTTISKLNIPMIKILEQVRANRWISLPESRLENSAMNSWKLNNVKMDEAEKRSIAQSIVKEKYPRLSKAEQKAKVESMVASSEVATTSSDTREKPLTIVDPNQFNYIQSAPFVSTAMECVNRLSKMIETETPVRMLFPNNMKSDDQSSKAKSQVLVFDDPERTIDLLTDRPNIAPLAIDLNSNTKANLVTDFGVPAFGGDATTAAAGESKHDSKVDKVIKDKLSAESAISESADSTSSTPAMSAANFQMATANQKLADFGWANINLVLSDHYQFIMSKDDDVAYIFIPLNFREEELMLFLNSHYDKIALIQKEFYNPVMGQTQKVVELQAIETLVKQTLEKSELASIKINANAVPLLAQQFESASFFKNIVFLSTDLKSIKTVGPHVDIVIGGKSYDIKFTNAENSRATVTLPHEDRTTFNFSRIISDLTSKSEFFKQLLPDYQSGSFNFSLLQQSSSSSTTTPKEQ
ncbi:hypothetical protein PPL_04030 [Heterostelium album PN500]|uniref:DUF4460 domain-containing protein n=1 Tax=Heterostelium pallidum (strain ATCC 26659 / Pp 5 / PN500) TaxID=670386 RepID=D3B5U2_HETP5|nr:hypothetical protein PPL_04030 [Heterostelium album PN500]EFA83240.1 hypothetical protein PPL_04030 [Heterostelium album PN500]|eukprot:XP_020435357.1 hypothetical protein PPL_04030 [Heterostelium album PN500]